MSVWHIIRLIQILHNCIIPSITYPSKSSITCHFGSAILFLPILFHPSLIHQNCHHLSIQVNIIFSTKRLFVNQMSSINQLSFVNHMQSWRLYKAIRRNVNVSYLPPVFDSPDLCQTSLPPLLPWIYSRTSLVIDMSSIKSDRSLIISILPTYCINRSPLIHLLHTIPPL
jgi:hypothetical protein